MMLKEFENLDKYLNLEREIVEYGFNSCAHHYKSTWTLTKSLAKKMEELEI